MFGSWNDFERTFAAMDELRRTVEQAWREDEAFPFQTAGAWPRVSLWDEGSNLVLKADLPGLTEKDLQLQLTQDVLTVTGSRRSDAPEGYSVHRQERLPARFSRSFTLPVKVDGAAISASLKDGVLTVTMPKAPESQPRQITVKAA
ncbi:MAG TPA: Hsp20/alpha crystallin family protein [Polyangia bacterium]|nr:Hsp20/alpha crystallin family protein [Polyangia bacterium]